MAETLEREEATVVVEETLTAMDRCDACNAQALVRVSMPKVSQTAELLFCGHHYNKSETNVVAQGGVVGIDNRQHKNPV